MTWFPNKTGGVYLAMEKPMFPSPLFRGNITPVTSVLGSNWARESKGAGNPGRQHALPNVTFFLSTLRTLLPLFHTLTQFFYTLEGVHIIKAVSFLL